MLAIFTSAKSCACALCPYTHPTPFSAPKSRASSDFSARRNSPARGNAAMEMGLHSSACKRLFGALNCTPKRAHGKRALVGHLATNGLPSSFGKSLASAQQERLPRYADVSDLPREQDGFGVAFALLLARRGYLKVGSNHQNSSSCLVFSTYLTKQLNLAGAG